MYVYEGETYLNVSEVCQHLGIVRDRFYRYQGYGLRKYRIPLTTIKQYRQSEVDQLKIARPVMGEQAPERG